MSAVLPESVNTENECDAAETWGEEDAVQGNGFCAPQFFIPGSLQWDAYQVGYDRGRQLMRRLSTYNPDATPEPLPRDSPGLWALRGYEDALFARSVRNQLPPIHDPDHANYHAGYAEGAAMLKSILPAAPKRTNSNSTGDTKPCTPTTNPEFWKPYLNPFHPPTSSGNLEP